MGVGETYIMGGQTYIHTNKPLYQGGLTYIQVNEKVYQEGGLTYNRDIRTNEHRSSYRGGA